MWGETERTWKKKRKDGKIKEDKIIKMCSIK